MWNESASPFALLGQRLLLPQVLRVFYQPPQRDTHCLSDAVGKVHGWISLKSFNERHHFGGNVRPFGQFLLTEKSGLPVFPHHFPEASGEIFGQHPASLPAPEVGLTGTMVPI
jgi:hypothetical protein